MAYVKMNKLDDNTGSGTVINAQLQECTPSEEACPASFYPEDIIRVSNQTGFHSLKKVMATFWGVRRQAWVGLDSGGKVLPDAVALRCPPYYPPHTGPGVDVSDMEKPEDFPPPSDLPC